MICPGCKLGISLDFLGEECYPDDWEAVDAKGSTGSGYGLAHGWCSECDQFIVLYRTGMVIKEKESHRFQGESTDIVIHPKISPRMINAPEIPERYRVDFNEAAEVFPISPKTSAAISRRSLQQILRDEYRIKEKSLAKEIEAFIHKKDIPSYISEAVDAVRNIGNFASHPMKESNTGEIIDVEPGEADWLLEVLESLLDFTFVQPKKLEERKRKLNEKLQSLGKPQLIQPPSTPEE